MGKKIIIAMAIIISLSIGWIFTSIAENEKTASPDALEKIAQLELKLDRLSSDLDRNNKEVVKKLDIILSNQDKILKELAIVKVRASAR